MKQTQANGVVIYADVREAGSRIASILGKKCTIHEQQLLAGDYLLSENVAAERKTTHDFVQSVIDGRLFRQVAHLKEAYPSSLLIIEGDDLLTTGRKVHPNALRGALAAIAISYSLPILWTKNQLETAELLYAIARREQLHNKRSVALRAKRKVRSTNEAQEFLVAGLPRISTTIAKRLLKHFGSPERIFTASEKDLMGVEGVGKETARMITKLLTKGYEKSILED